MFHLIYISIITALCNWNSIYDSINCGFRLSNFEQLKLQGGLFITRSGSFKAVNLRQFEKRRCHNKSGTCRKSKKWCMEKTKILFTLCFDNKKFEKLFSKNHSRNHRKAFSAGDPTSQDVICFPSRLEIFSMVGCRKALDSIITLHLSVCWLSDDRLRK